ncbi:hypothetical protein HAX54_049071, partial [Datura stramonium]|nr:hypothetical protein [Datura stramonium]
VHTTTCLMLIAAYLPSHIGHGSFDAVPAAAESFHMQFQGLYLPPRPARNWCGSAMADNIGAQRVLHCLIKFFEEQFTIYFVDSEINKMGS